MKKKTRSRPQIAIDVPDILHARVKAKALREGISVRALILTYLAAWTARPPSVIHRDRDQNIDDEHARPPRKWNADGTFIERQAKRL